MVDDGVDVFKFLALLLSYQIIFVGAKHDCVLFDGSFQCGCIKVLKLFHYAKHSHTVSNVVALIRGNIYSQKIMYVIG